MARGSHGLPKVSLRPVMPTLSLPCGRPPLKWRYAHFRGGCPQGGWPAAVLLPPWIPQAVRLWFLTCTFFCTCPPQTGHYSEKESAQCQICPKGTHIDHDDPQFGTECLSCPGGYACKDGEKLTDTCEEGKFSPEWSETCDLCLQGQMTNGEGQSACVPCEKGFKCEAGKKKGKCTEGEFSPAGMDECRVCPVGSVSAAGAGVCDSCPAGVDCTGGIQVGPCPQDTSSTTGSAICLKCPAGTFSATKSASCTVCDEGLDCRWIPGSRGCWSMVSLGLI
jgi:hypothetical protein